MPSHSIQSSNKLSLGQVSQTVTLGLGLGLGNGESLKDNAIKKCSASNIQCDAAKRHTNYNHEQHDGGCRTYKRKQI